MEWDQIEHEWTAMTRRIRADWKGGPESTQPLRDAQAETPAVADEPSDGTPLDTMSDNGRVPPNR